MSDSIFETEDAHRFTPTDAALGPWTDQALHGGPSLMLLARAIERFHPDEGMFVARLTFELLRPVRSAPLSVRCRLTRPGRKVQLVEASLWQQEQEVARSTALRIRRAAIDLPEHQGRPPLTLADANHGWTAPYGPGPAYHVTGVEIRTPEAGDSGKAPERAWVRLRVPLVPGEEPSALVRACAAADFPNGISYVLDPRRVTYINPDVTLYLHRLPAGPWVMVDARTWLRSYGTGVAEGVLYDQNGRIGHALQALLLEPRS